MNQVPCVVLALALNDGPADSVIPAVQNLMLAARAIGIGSVPTTLHPSVMARFRRMFEIPNEVGFHFCVPLGYPQGNFGSERPQADVGDDRPRPMGCPGSLELTSSPRYARRGSAALPTP
jgi:hypothetical protein